MWIQLWTVFFFSLLFHSWKSWRRWRGDNGNGGRAGVLAAAVVSGVVLVVGDVIQDGATETRYMSPHPPIHPSVHGKKKKKTNNNKKKKKTQHNFPIFRIKRHWRAFRWIVSFIRFEIVSFIASFGLRTLLLALPPFIPNNRKWGGPPSVVDLFVFLLLNSKWRRIRRWCGDYFKAPASSSFWVIIITLPHRRLHPDRSSCWFFILIHISRGRHLMWI